MNKSHKKCPTCKGKQKLPREVFNEKQYPFKICDDCNGLGYVSDIKYNRLTKED